MNTLPGWTQLETTVRGVPLAHRMREGQVPVLMVHGIGPGSSGEVNFAPPIRHLSPHLAIHLIDLAGFGRSGRLPAPPFFDVAFWLEQIDAALARIATLHQRLPLLIGNSVGGALSLRIAARRRDLPQVVAIGAPAAATATPELRAFWAVPHDPAALAAALQPMTGAARPPDPDIVTRRLAPFLSGDYRDYFATMLADPDSCLQAVVLAASEARRIETRVALLHGDRDRASPVADTLALRDHLPRADLTLFGGCGHDLMSERPADIANIIEFLARKVEPS